MKIFARKSPEKQHWVPGLLLLVGAFQAGCVGNLESNRGYARPVTDPVEIQTFVPVSSSSYANKTKLLLTGTPITDAEATQVQTDAGYAALVDSWMQSDSYKQTLITFFSEAFQQSQVSGADTVAQAGVGSASPIDLQLLQQSFALTMLNFVENNQPLTKALTTTTFMMTPRLLMWYAFIEALETDDSGDTTDYYLQRNSAFKFSLKLGAPAISLADSANPASANYMTWSYPGGSPQSFFPGQPAAPCQLVNNTLTITVDRRQDLQSFSLYYALARGYGPNYVQNGVNCTIPGPGDGKSLVTPEDATTWRMVTLTVAKDGNSAVPFWDLQTLRTASTIALRNPRIGFFTTPSFLAQYATNRGNQARGVTNQTLIVALGKSFNGSDATLPASRAALDLEHAAPGTPCFGCHITLDPMRQFFRNQFTFSYDVQRDPTQTALPGVWARNQSTYVSQNGLSDLGQSLANDAGFAMAWVQKTCSWINSSSCDVTDPLLVKIANDFQASNFQFSPMLRALLLSPVTTYAAASQSSTSSGTTVSIARREQFCRGLSSRLGIDDICGLNATTQLPATLGPVTPLAYAYPADGYSRGAISSPAVTVPTLAMRTGLENICGYISLYVVDNGQSSIFNTSDVDGSIDDMVVRLFGLGPQRNQAVQSILKDHYDAALFEGATKTVAMRSAFTLACLSPWASMVGEVP